VIRGYRKDFFSKNTASSELAAGQREAIGLSCMIEVQELTKRYGDFTAVRDLSFAVRPGEVNRTHREVPREGSRCA